MRTGWITGCCSGKNSGTAWIRDCRRTSWRTWGHKTKYSGRNTDKDKDCMVRQKQSHKFSQEKQLVKIFTWTRNMCTQQLLTRFMGFSFLKCPRELFENAYICIFPTFQETVWGHLKGVRTYLFWPVARENLILLQSLWIFTNLIPTWDILYVVYVDKVLSFLDIIWWHHDDKLYQASNVQKCT